MFSKSDPPTQMTNYISHNNKAIIQDTILQNIIYQIVNIAHPDKIILFGSRATGKAKKDSDYDICVLKKNVKNIGELEKKFYMDLYGVGAGVDVIVQSEKKFNQLKDKWFLIYNNVFNHGKIVYEK